jgi:hypothetical protein
MQVHLKNSNAVTQASLYAWDNQQSIKQAGMFVLGQTTQHKTKSIR